MKLKVKLKDIFRGFRRTKGTFEERQGLSQDGRRRKEAKGTVYDSFSFRLVIFACDKREGKGIACVTREVYSSITLNQPQL